jgi:hypothetical protein
LPCPRRHGLPGDPPQQDAERLASALVARVQRLREFGIGRYRFMQPPHGRVCVPECAEDFDQPVERRAWIRHRHRFGNLREATVLRDRVEDGFQQSSPRSELMVDGQPCHACRLRHQIQREGGDARILAQRSGCRFDDASPLFCGRGGPNRTHIAACRHPSLLPCC